MCGALSQVTILRVSALDARGAGDGGVGVLLLMVGVIVARQGRPGHGTMCSA